MDTPALNVLLQSGGSPTSLPIDFKVPGLEAHHFVAWGLDCGTISVGLFEQPPEAHDPLQDVSTTSTALRHVLTLHVPPQPSATTPPASPTENKTCSTQDGEHRMVTHLAYGGGPHLLLAASTADRLAVFSLEPLMPHIFLADATAATAATSFNDEVLPWEISPKAQCEEYLVGAMDLPPSLESFHASSPSSLAAPPATAAAAAEGVSPIALCWTQQLDGVMISHAGGSLTMWRIEPCATPSVDEDGVSRCVNANFHKAWHVAAPEAQDVISAGVNVEAPSASASSSGERCANVWWPENIVVESAGIAAKGRETTTVRREKLRHSCQVLFLEWCPGILRKDVLAAGLLHHTDGVDAASSKMANGETDEVEDTTNAASAPEDHPALMTVGSDHSVRLWVEMLVVMHVPTPMPSGVPSLNATPKSGIIGTPTTSSTPLLDAASAAARRTSPSDVHLGTGKAATPFSASAHVVPDQLSPSTSNRHQTPQSTRQQQQTMLDSYFAMALVVNPFADVFANTIGATGSSSSAAHYHQRRPRQQQEEKQQQRQQQQENLEQSSTVSVIARWARPTAAMIGLERQRAATTPAADVLWLLAAVPLPPSSADAAEPPNTSFGHLIRLYAVRGLAPVVIASLPGSVSGASTLNPGTKPPQAVLWGEHRWGGAVGPVSRDSPSANVLFPFTSSKHDSLQRPLQIAAAPSAFSAWLGAENDFPRVTCFEARCGTIDGESCDALHASAITYATVLAECPEAPTGLKQRMEAVLGWHAGITTHSCRITDSAVSGCGSLAATVDDSGTVLVWKGLRSALTCAAVVMVPKPAGRRCSLRWFETQSTGEDSRGLAALSSTGPRTSSRNDDGRLCAGGGLIAGRGSFLAIASGNEVVVLEFSMSCSGASDDGVRVSQLIRLEHGVSALERCMDGTSNPLQFAAFGAAEDDDRDPKLSLLQITVGVVEDPTHASVLRLSPRTNRREYAANAIALCHVATASLPANVLLRSSTVASWPTIPRTFLVASSDGHVSVLSAHMVHRSDADTAPIPSPPPPKQLEIKELGTLPPCFAHIGAPVSRGVPGASWMIDAVAVDAAHGMVASICSTMHQGGHKRSVIMYWKVLLYAPTDNDNCGSLEPSGPLTTNLSSDRLATASAGKLLPLDKLFERQRRAFSRSSLPTTISWVPGLVAACLAVGFTNGALALFAPATRIEEGAWTPIATLSPSLASLARELPITSVHAAACSTSAEIVTPTTPTMVLTSGANLLALSADVWGNAMTGFPTTDQKLLSRLVLETSGPLAQYHPRFLRMLLQTGRREAAAKILQALASWLPQYQRHIEQHSAPGGKLSLSRMVSDASTASSVAAAAATAIGPEGGASILSPRSGVPTPKVASLNALPPAFVGLSLNELMETSAALSSLGESMKRVAEERANAVREIRRGGASLDVPSRSTVGNGRTDARNERPGGGVPEAASNNLDTGTVDLAAFGMAPSLPSPPLPQQQQSVDTGMVDLAAFGMAPSLPSPPLPQQQQSVDTGMVDLAAFGMAPSPPSPQPQPQQQQGVDTGMVDLVAFGMAPSPPSPALPQQQHHQQQRHAASSVTKPQGKTIAALKPPRQGQVVAEQLSMLPADVVKSLHRLLHASPHLTPSSASNTNISSAAHDDATAAIDGMQSYTDNNQYKAEQPSSLSECFVLWPATALPGLSLDETAHVLRIAGSFSKVNGGFNCNQSVDEAGANFLSALTLAGCTDDALDDPRDTTEHRLTGGSAAAALAPEAAPYVSITPGGGNSSTSIGKKKPASIRRNASTVRNAAGVEYTLPRQLSAGNRAAAAIQVDISNGSVGNERKQPQSLWGLVPGLDTSALLWACLSDAHQALLEHAMERVGVFRAISRVRNEKAHMRRDAKGETPAMHTSDSAASFMRPSASTTSMASSSTAGAASGGAGAFSATHAGAYKGGVALTWEDLKAVGAGFWLRDPEALRSIAEKLAKSRFAATRKPDDAALLYAAIGKKTVLQGLYRTVQQARQADFLSRDFSQPRHAEAACKNAFVLLSQHRYEVAAAFFLLGGRPQDAVGVCMRELKDLQLALFISRLIGETRAIGDGNLEAETIQRYLADVTLSQARDASWIKALTAWLSGSKWRCVAALLGSGDFEDDHDQARKTGISMQFDSGLLRPAETAAQLLPALAMVSAASALPGNFVLDEEDERTCTRFAQTDALLRSLYLRSAAISEALLAAGLPAEALRADVAAASCGLHVIDALEQQQQKRRFATACAAALLPQPFGAATQQQQQHALGDASLEKEWLLFQQQLQHPLGIAFDTKDVLSRLHALQNAAVADAYPHWAASADTPIGPSAPLRDGGGIHQPCPWTPRASGTLSPTFGSLHREGSFDAGRSAGIASSHKASSEHSSTARLREPAATRGGVTASTGALRSSDSSSGIVGDGRGPLAPGVQIFHVDGDSIHAAAVCPLISPAVLGRPIVAACHKHGLLEFAAQALPPGHRHHQTFPLPEGDEAQEHELPDVLSEPSSSPRDSQQHTTSSSASWAFPRFLSQVFDQSTWAHDPLERSHTAIDGDVGLAVASAMAAAHSGGPASSARSSSSSPLLQSRPGSTHSYVLAAHPTRQLLLSTCQASGKILLWQFGGPRPVAAFTPVQKSDLAATQADTGLLSFSTRFAKSHSMTSCMFNWNGATGLTFSPNGERFAGIGDGGVVATWRLSGTNRAADVDGAFCSEWWHQCLSKHGRAVTFIGGSGGVLAVGGKCTAGNLAVWDTASPPSQACVGRLTHHAATVNALCTLPGGWLLAAADAAGALSLTDIRMLGGGSGGARVLWSVRAAKGPITAVTSLPLRSLAERPRALALGAATGATSVLVSGGDDGAVRVWQASTGQLLQSLEGSHGSTKGGRRLSLGGGVGGVTGLARGEDVLVSCGGDGIVKMYGLVEGSGKTCSTHGHSD